MPFGQEKNLTMLTIQRIKYLHRVGLHITCTPKTNNSHASYGWTVSCSQKYALDRMSKEILLSYYIHVWVVKHHPMPAFKYLPSGIEHLDRDLRTQLIPLALSKATEQR